jgi:SET domain-containing protein
LRAPGRGSAKRATSRQHSRRAIERGSLLRQNPDLTPSGKSGTKSARPKLKARYPLVVKTSRIAGRGVFAIADIPWGRKIMRYQGAVIGDQEAGKRTAQGATAVMELGGGRNVDGFDGGNGAAWINHGRRRPNCFLLREQGEIWIVAGVEGISAGDELTYDYGSEYYPRRKAR